LDPLIQPSQGKIAVGRDWSLGAVPRYSYSSQAVDDAVLPWNHGLAVGVCKVVRACEVADFRWRGLVR